MRGRQKPLETVVGKRVIVTRSLSHKRFIAQALHRTSASSHKIIITTRKYNAEKIYIVECERTASMSGEGIQ